jgi:hypothetical protein
MQQGWFFLLSGVVLLLFVQISWRKLRGYRQRRKEAERFNSAPERQFPT